MENLKLHIEERLWNFIKRNYNTENYSNAILDSIQFIGDIIREKSGLDSDGIQLVGAAFGGENPKIKLNSLNTESEKNFQKGIENLLRGVYSAYRNPRSHSKIEDSELNAFEIITFLNHLLKIIDKSTGKFTSELFLKRVFDEDFVQTKKYAELLTKEIPKSKYFEIAIEIFKSKETGKIHNLKLVWDCVFLKITETQKKELFTLVADELRFTNSLSAITKCICLFKDSWLKIEEDARLRSENKLLKTLSTAEKTIYGKLNDAAIYCTWLTSILQHSGLKEEIGDQIFDMLESGNENKQRFAIDYFGGYFDEIETHTLFRSYKDILKKELGRGNGTIHSYVTRKFKGPDKEEFTPYLENFVLINSDDDLPF